MDILFLDKFTGKSAKLTSDSANFVINSNGQICETNKHHPFSLIRDDVIAVLNPLESDENIKALCVNCGAQKIATLRCGKCDYWIGS